MIPRPITDAEARRWPHVCGMCGESIGAAQWQDHRAGHRYEMNHRLEHSARGATHAMLAFGDALERLRQAGAGGEG